MNNTLHLTKGELELFNKLSDAVRNGWKPVEEVLTFEDTTHRRYMRMSVMKLHDPRLLGLRDQLMNMQEKPEEARKLLDSLDVSSINDDDMMQLFYAMGPDALSFMIIQILMDNPDDAALEMVASLSMIRHMILFAFVEAYSSPSYS